MHRRICFAMLLFGLALEPAAATSPRTGAMKLYLPEENYTLSFPDDVASNQQIAPGAEGSFAFTLRDTKGTTKDRRLSGALYVDADVLAEYQFVSEHPRCRTPEFRIDFGRELVFVVEALAPSESFTCRYRIQRAPTSRNDLKFESCGDVTFPYCERAFRRGSLPDLQLGATPVAPTPRGALSAIVRLQLRNPTAYPVPFRDVTTDCWEFEGGQGGPGPFRIDSDIPGGCPSVSGEACFNFGGQNALSYGFRLGPAVAGGSSSCLVRLTLTRPLSGFVSTPFHFLTDEIVYPDGSRRFDGNAANDTIPLGVSPAVSPATVPLAPTTSLAMAVLVGMLACLRLRNR